jgi:mannose-6-phosphate isomerase-like protein (cupin superfamily)
MDHPDILHGVCADETLTPERCFITELWNHADDTAASVAQARVEPGVLTQRHRLDVDERYVITKGCGRVQLEGLDPQIVVAGDVVLIPAHCAQQIENIGREDLVFLCVCTPRFELSCYHPADDS